MSGGALSNLKVIELGSYISAAFCGKLLADYGAEVIKVERPIYGDESRHAGPFLHDIPSPERSGLFLYLNTSKYGVTLDPGTPTGRSILLRLLADADVLVHNLPPKTMEEMGLTWETVHGHNSNLIMTSITGFGQFGPYRDYKGYALNYSAIGGMNHGEGFPDREPLTWPLSQSHYLAGLSGAIGTLLAACARRLIGAGQHVDISETDFLASFMGGAAVQPFIEEGRIRPRSGHRAPRAPHLDAVLPCKDGYVILDTPQRRQWQRFLEMLGKPAWGEDPRFAKGLGIMDEHGDEIEANLAPWLMAHTKQEIFEQCIKHQVPAAPLFTVDELLQEEHLKVREFFVEVEREEVGTLKYVGAPAKFSRTPWRIARPAPRLGEHNEAILRGRLGYSPQDLVRLRRAGVI